MVFNCPTCNIIVYGEYWDSCEFCDFTTMIKDPIFLQK